jgi:hypothetical protein
MSYKDLPHCSICDGEVVRIRKSIYNTYTCNSGHSWPKAPSKFELKAEVKDIDDIITVQDLIDALNKLPKDRKQDLLAIWIDDDGTRHRVKYIDETVTGTIDLSIGYLDPSKDIDS